MRPGIARAGGAAALALVLWAAPTVAQGASAQGDEPEEKVDLKELFRQVENDLSEIDRLLLNASEQPARDAAPSVARGSARDANARQKRVVETIQRILESAPP